MPGCGVKGLSKAKVCRDDGVSSAARSRQCARFRRLLPQWRTPFSPPSAPPPQRSCFSAECTAPPARVFAAVITASANGTARVALVEPLALLGDTLSACGLYLQDQLKSGYTSIFVSGVAREWADRLRRRLRRLGGRAHARRQCGAGGGGRHARGEALNHPAHGLCASACGAHGRPAGARDAGLPPQAPLCARAC